MNRRDSYHQKRQRELRRERLLDYAISTFAFLGKVCAVVLIILLIGYAFIQRM